MLGPTVPENQRERGIVKEKVLLVDDDPNILAGFRRNFRHHFEIVTAESGAAGLVILKKKGRLRWWFRTCECPRWTAFSFSL